MIKQSNPSMPEGFDCLIVVRYGGVYEQSK